MQVLRKASPFNKSSQAISSTAIYSKSTHIVEVSLESCPSFFGSFLSRIVIGCVSLHWSFMFHKEGFLDKPKIHEDATCVSIEALQLLSWQLDRNMMMRMTL